MPYCVKCGVELAEHAKRCPLCKWVVVYPEGDGFEEEGLYPRSSHQELPTEEPFRPTVFGLAIYTLMLAIPLIVTWMIDLKGNGRITWSMYVISSLLLTWFLTTIPWWFRQRRFAKSLTFGTVVLSGYLYLLDAYTSPVSWAWYAITALTLFWVYLGLPGWLPVQGRAIWAILVDAVATMGYLWFIEWQTGTGPWCATLGVPLVALVSAVSLALVWLIETGQIRDYTIPGSILIALGLLSFGVELIVKLYLQQSGLVSWSLVVLAASLPLSAIFFMVHNKVELQVLLKKKFHL